MPANECHLTPAQGANRGLLTPPRLYLDTAHLINIYGIRHGHHVPSQFAEAYATINDCIMNRHFGVFYSLAAPMEWVDGNATEESACRIASILDSAPLRYFFEGDTFIFLDEILRQVRAANPQLRVPSLPCLQVTRIQTMQWLQLSLSGNDASCSKRRTKVQRLNALAASENLNNQHRVAVAVEAVLAGDGFGVDFLEAVQADERGHEGQQRRARQVKVRHQRIHAAEPIRRRDQ